MLKAFITFILGAVSYSIIDNYLTRIKFSTKFILSKDVKFMINRDPIFYFTTLYESTTIDGYNNLPLQEIYHVSNDEKIVIDYTCYEEASIAKSIQYYKYDELHRDLYEGPAVIIFDDDSKDVIKSEYWVHGELITHYDHVIREYS